MSIDIKKHTNRGLMAILTLLDRISNAAKIGGNFDITAIASCEVAVSLCSAASDILGNQVEVVLEWRHEDRQLLNDCVGLVLCAPFGGGVAQLGTNSIPGGKVVFQHGSFRGRGRHALNLRHPLTVVTFSDSSESGYDVQIRLLDLSSSPELEIDLVNYYRGLQAISLKKCRDFDSESVFRWSQTVNAHLRNYTRIDSLWKLQVCRQVIAIAATFAHDRAGVDNAKIAEALVADEDIENTVNLLASCRLMVPGQHLTPEQFNLTRALEENAHLLTIASAEKDDEAKIRKAASVPMRALGHQEFGAGGVSAESAMAPKSFDTTCLCSTVPVWREIHPSTATKHLHNLEAKGIVSKSGKTGTGRGRAVIWELRPHRLHSKGRLLTDYFLEIASQS